MQEGKLFIFSFSSVDIGFPSITFANVWISLNLYHCKIPVKGWERLFGQIQCGFFFVCFFLCVFFVCFFISDGWRLKQATHPIPGILVNKY